MEENYDTDAFAARVAEVLRTRFQGNKKAAYTRAGVNAGTFERALTGRRLRPDRRHAIEDAFWPEEGYVSAPGDTVAGGASNDEVLAAIERMQEDIRDMARKQAEQGERLDRIERAAGS